MASGLFDMLADLAKDPSLLSSFTSNPDSVMDNYYLTQDQKTHIKSSLHNGMSHDFYKVIGDEAHAQFGGGSSSQSSGPQIAQQVSKPGDETPGPDLIFC